MEKSWDEDRENYLIIERCSDFKTTALILALLTVSSMLKTLQLRYFQQVGE